MRVRVLVFCVLACMAAEVCAAELRPITQKAVCVTDAAGQARIDRDKVRTALLGTLSYNDLLKAVAKARSKAKSKDAVPSAEELTAYASEDPRLLEFLQSYDKGLYEIRWSPQCARSRAITGQDFLRDAACVIARCKSFQAPPPDQVKKKPLVEAEFRLRRTAESLRVPLTPATDAKAVPAHLSVTRNVSGDTTLIQGEATAGLAFAGHLTEVTRPDGKVQRYDPFTFIPYVTYNRVSSTPKKPSDVDKLGVGALLNATLSSRDIIGHEFTFKTQYTTDQEGETSIATGEFIYYPLLSLTPDFDPFGGFAWSGPIGMYVEPSFPVRYSRVFDPGANPALLDNQHYVFGGSQLMVVFAGNPEVTPELFENLRLRLQYIWLHGFDGPLDHFKRFEAELTYIFPTAKNFGVGLRYVNGNTDITLQESERIEATFNVRF